MKRFLLLGAMALGLSGCVSDYPGGRVYDPYWDGYEQERIVIYNDRARPRPIYRDDRLYRDDRPSYRGPYRNVSRDARRASRRDEDRRTDNRRSEERRPERSADGLGRRGSSAAISGEGVSESTARVPSQTRAQRTPDTRPSIGPRPYTPPVRPQ